MNYSFKVTTAGRELLATLLATGQVLELTRVAVGSGRVAEDANLADMTDLIQYVAEGTLTQRRHEDNILHLTVQYASNSTPGLGAFYLSEIIVQAKHPDTGENITFLYATLGDYIQHVNAYSEVLPPDIRNYPMMIAISDEINVSVTAPVGLVTYDELEQACEDLRNTLVTKMLLWENASAMGGFESQRIIIDVIMPDYDGYEIVYYDSTHINYDSSLYSSGYLPAIMNKPYKLVAHYLGPGSSTWHRNVGFEEVTAGFCLMFGSGYQKGDNNSGIGEEYNSCIIPYRIYGIKGVN